jgi:hypothetical protein
LGGVGGVKVGLGGQLCFQPLIEVKGSEEVNSQAEGEHDEQGGQEENRGQPPSQALSPLGQFLC